MKEDNKLLELIDEAIELEMNVGKLYSLFGRRCAKDRTFWLQIEIEEYNHAALLRASKEFVAYSKFPLDLIPRHQEQIRQSIQKVIESYNRFESNPDRFEAFSIAYELENSAGELHYQQFMESSKQDSITSTFKKLNQADTDHAKRILAYWTDANQEKNKL